MWVLQNYTLNKPVGSSKVSQPAGYSLHCFDAEFKEIYYQYIPSHDNAIMFEKEDESELSFIIAEKSRIKTIQIRGEKDVKIIKQMKMVEEIKQIEVNERYNIISIVNSSGSY